MRPLVTFIFGNPGDDNYVYETREMNDQEYAKYLEDKAIFDAKEAERIAREQETAVAKAAVETKLAALGLDLETIKTIAKL